MMYVRTLRLWDYIRVVSTIVWRRRQQQRKKMWNRRFFTKIKISLFLDKGRHTLCHRENTHTIIWYTAAVYATADTPFPPLIHWLMWECTHTCFSSNTDYSLCKRRPNSSVYYEYHGGIRFDVEGLSRRPRAAETYLLLCGVCFWFEWQEYTTHHTHSTCHHRVVHKPRDDAVVVRDSGHDRHFFVVSIKLSEDDSSKQRRWWRRAPQSYYNNDSPQREHRHGRERRRCDGAVQDGHWSSENYDSSRHHSNWKVLRRNVGWSKGGLILRVYPIMYVWVRLLLYFFAWWLHSTTLRNLILLYPARWKNTLSCILARGGLVRCGDQLLHTYYRNNIEYRHLVRAICMYRYY